MVLLACTMIVVSGSVLAQSSSENFRISTQAVVAGSGVSSNLSGQIDGVLPTVGTGYSYERRLAVYVGNVAMHLGEGGKFLSFYRDQLLDTLEIADQTFKVIINGGSGTPVGTFYHRPGGRQTYESETMYMLGDDSMAVDLPSTAINCRGLEYYFELTRGDEFISLGEDDSPMVVVSHVTNATGVRPDSTRPGKHQMVAVPLIVDGANAVTDVFGDDFGAADPTLWRLGHYSVGSDSVIEYPNSAPATPGQAWWLITSTPRTYGAAGYTVRPNRTYDGDSYYELPLVAGWNQIANPFPFNLDWRDVLVDRDGSVVGIDGGLIDDVAYWYSGFGYFWANTLPAWDGFFVFARRDDLKMLFPYREQIRLAEKAGLVSPADASPEALWTLHVGIESEGLSDDGNFVGVHSEALEGLDRFDQADPPPPPGAPRLAFVLPDEDPYLRRIDMRPPLEDGAIWQLELAPAENRSLTIAGVEALPSHLEAVLVFDIGTTVLLTEGEAVEVPFDSRSAQLLVGNRSFTAEEVASILPEHCQLHQNFPNPFNPVTSLRFTLPSEGHVLLEVYNLLGQRVITLVNRMTSAGTHTVTWNALDSEGRPVATGVYFYRITTDEFTDVKKMLLLK